MQFCIFPIGGEGRRFSSKDFVDPKPFVEIYGRSQLEWSVLSCRRNFPEAQIIIGYRSGLATRCLEFVERSAKEYGLNIKAVDIGVATLGAAHSVALVLEKIGCSTKDFEFLVLDNDVALKLSHEKRFLNGSAGLVTTKSKNPSHSFVIFDELGIVKSIEEKVIISDDGVVGNYFFKSAAEYLDHFARLPSAEDEKDVSNVIKSYLRNDSLVLAESALAVCSFGTPEELSLLNPESFKFIGIEIV